MKKILIILLVLGLLIGCASVRESALRISEEDVITAGVSREVALNLLKTWPINSGFIRGALGDRLSELPQQAIDAMDLLDVLAEEYLKDGEEAIDDWEAGRSLGLRIRLMAATVQEALRLFAPEVLQVLPVALILS